MNKFDRQRIENALWTIERYYDEFYEVMNGIFVNDVWVSPSDILYVLQVAKNNMEFEEEL